MLGDDKFSKWRKMDVVELKALLGFNILMAILPSIDDYWKRDPLRYSPVADRISRDRFRELSQYLHFVDNNTLVPRGSPGHDRLGKVRQLIDHLASRFTEMYEPHCEVSVDEAMIKFQGRFSLKEYMPLKPTKRGVTVRSPAYRKFIRCTDVRGLCILQISFSLVVPLKNRKWANYQQVQNT